MGSAISTVRIIILHNVIREDNVVLEERKGIIIDFGKACYEKDGKR